MYTHPPTIVNCFNVLCSFAWRRLFPSLLEGFKDARSVAPSRAHVGLPLARRESDVKGSKLA